MPDVFGELRDIVGSNMSDRVGTLVFRLNRPQINTLGGIFPTEEKEITPGPDSKFNVSLAQTTTMLDDAWYELGVNWKESNHTAWDFPDWKIRVPSGGGNVADLIDRTPSGGGSNFYLVWVGPNEPAHKWPGVMWLQLDPDNPSASTNSGNLRRWE